jgi:hypothetical protein
MKIIYRKMSGKRVEEYVCALRIELDKGEAISAVGMYSKSEKKKKKGN